MKTLAIDSSLPSGSVAALHAGRVVEELLPAAGEHARRLAAALAALSGRLGWKVGEAEVIAVVRGPGSFTGLRVGLATAKAIAWTTGATLVGVSGFELVARESARQMRRAGADVHVAYDAGRGDLFVAAVSPTADLPGGWTAATPRLVAADDWLANLPHGAVVTGPALAILADQAAARADLLAAPREAWMPTAAAAGALAVELAAAGRADDPRSLVPDYLRPSYAHEAADPLSRAARSSG
jgi:tRNA threonylcarbamoyladenosine biosynthesis protein TsaB